MAEEKKKKRRGRREHLKDFYQDVTGKYVYGGTMYTCGLPKEEYKRLLNILWLCGGGTMAAQILAGCIPAAGMQEGFWVLPFYLGAIISCGMVCWALGELTSGGDPIREYIYAASVEKLPRRCEFSMVFSGLCLVGLLVKLLWSGLQNSSLWATVLFVAIQIAAIGAMLTIKKMINNLHWCKK